MAQNVSKTTKAFQMISTSKLKKAQEAAISSRTYVNQLTDLVNSLTKKVDNENRHPYMKSSLGNKKKLLIVISPDKGLCGGLVSNLLKEVYTLNKEHPLYIVIGKKAEGIVSKLDGEIIASFPFGTSLPTFDAVFPVSKIIDDYYLSGKVSDVEVIFSHFNNVFTQTPTVKDILPVKIGIESGQENYSLFEPAIEKMLPDLLKHYLEMSLYQNLLENFASEQGARMVSMKNATDNAEDMIDYLKLEYNKLRQEKITNEILDIGSASFALAYE